MLHSEEIKPRWVIVGDKPRAVTEFADLKPKSRPQAFCPVCEDVVVLKLGTERAHHYAHKTEVICAATKPETALHLNVKYYLHDQLQNADKIFIDEKCAWGCGSIREVVWLQGWDNVEVEHSIGGVRPDVMLFQAGQPIGALEVLVSHKISVQKADYFRETNLPVIEVLANDEFYSGENRWTPDQPLPFYRLFPAVKAWVCEQCLSRLRKPEPMPEQTDADSEKLFDNEDDRQEVLAVSIVDFYYKIGTKYREMYIYMQDYVAGKVERIWVHDRAGRTIFLDKSPEIDSLEELKKAIGVVVVERTLDGAIIDIQLELESWPQGRQVSFKEFEHYPYRFQWDEGQFEWVNTVTGPQAQAEKTVNEFIGVLHSSFLHPRAVPCESCGELKFSHQYIVFNGANQTCICRECLNKKEWPDLQPRSLP